MNTKNVYYPLAGMNYVIDDFGINLENDFSFQSKFDEKHLVKNYPIATIHYFK